MSVKHLAIKQYREIVDRAAAAVDKQLSRPSEGWIATTRTALGMSAAQLARRLRVTRARVSQAEHAELSGGVTLKTMQSMAEAMGCRFVYAIVPQDASIENAIKAQAHRKAVALVNKASTHMALERQSLSVVKNKEEIERIASELMHTMPADFWAAD